MIKLILEMARLINVEIKYVQAMAYAIHLQVCALAIQDGEEIIVTLKLKIVMIIVLMRLELNIFVNKRKDQDHVIENLQVIIIYIKFLFFLPI